jgi:hypothetical protein
VTESSRKVVLVTGMGRSGSTIVQKVLNAHAHACITDESWHFYSQGRWLSDMTDRKRCGLSDRQLMEVCAAFVFGLYRRMPGYETARCFGDKCPPAYSELKNIESMTVAAGHELFWVWTVRHPFDTALSWVERFGHDSIAELAFYRGMRFPPLTDRQRASPDAAAGYVFARCLECWKASVESLNRNAQCTVVYEQLVDNPVAVLGGLHASLGLTFDEKQIEEMFRARSLGGDPKFNTTSSVHQQSRFRYRREDGRRRALLGSIARELELGALMTPFGYELT